MEPTLPEVLFQCLLAPIMAVIMISVGLCSFIALLDLLTGTTPGSKDSLLYPFFQDGAIFGPSKKNKP